MITLIILIAIWGLISLYKIYKHTIKRGTPFDIMETPSDITYAGALVFIAMCIAILVLTCLFFLP
jgi:hypothetical protein